MKKIIIPIIALALFSCQNNNEKKENSNPTETTPTTQNKSEPSKLQNTAPAGQVFAPEFSIKLDLDAQLDEKLKSAKESIILSIEVVVTGDLNKEAQKKLEAFMDEKESATIGQIEKEVTMERTITVSDLAVDKGILELVGENHLEVQIQMWSGRKAFENNVINGDFKSEPYAKIAGKTITLKGSEL